MRVLQATQHIPVPDDGVPPGYEEHITGYLKRSLYEQLDKHLAETPGGVILGPIRVASRTEDDWLFNMGRYTTVQVSATCEDLPEPPEYRLIGGPADGRIIQTRGERVWRIALMPPIHTIVSYAALDGPDPKEVAVYERQGDTSAYFYARTEQA